MEIFLASALPLIVAIEVSSTSSKKNALIFSCIVPEIVKNIKGKKQSKKHERRREEKE